MPQVDAIAEAAARAPLAARVRLGVYLAALPHLAQRPPSFEKGIARAETFPARQNPFQTLCCMSLGHLMMMMMFITMHLAMYLQPVLHVNRL